MYQLTIEGRLPSANDYIEACRRNKYKAAKMKRDAQDYIIANIRQQIPDVHIYGRARIHFKWFEPNSRRDIDNVAFAKKFVLDALVEAETIPDDSQKYVTSFTDEITTDKDKPRIEVYLEEY